MSEGENCNAGKEKKGSAGWIKEGCDGLKKDMMNKRRIGWIKEGYDGLKKDMMD